jgi:serine phosphatase RsbU (regulator of sigma subunit)
VDLVWANNDAHPEALVQTLLAALSDFTQGSPQRDDITMLCLKVV